MAAPIEIGIASETKAFRAGVEAGIIAPLENTEQALTDLGKNKGPEQLEKELADAGDETKTLKKQIDQTATALEEAGSAARAAARKMKQGADDGSEALKKTEETASNVGGALGNLGEVAKSALEGDLTGAAEKGIDALAGMSAMMPGIGAAVGVGLAEIAKMMIAEIGGASERVKEITSANFSEMAKNGIEAWKSTASQMERLQDAYGKNRDQIEAIGKMTGLTFEQVAEAWIGNKDAVDLVNDAYDKQIQKSNEVFAGNRSAADQNAAALAGIMKPLNEVTTGYENAEKQARQFAEQSSALLLQAAVDAQTVSEELDAAGNLLLTLPDQTKILIDADTGLATTNIQKFKGDVDGIAETKKVTFEAEADLSAADRAITNYKNSVHRFVLTAVVQDQYGRTVE